MNFTCVNKKNLGWWIHGPCLKGDLYSYLEQIHHQLWLHLTFIGFSLTSNLLSCWSMCFMYLIVEANCFTKSATLKEPCCHALANLQVLHMVFFMFFSNVVDIGYFPPREPTNMYHDSYIFKLVEKNLLYNMVFFHCDLKIKGFEANQFTNIVKSKAPTYL